LLIYCSTQRTTGICAVLETKLDNTSPQSHVRVLLFKGVVVIPLTPYEL